MGPFPGKRNPPSISFAKATTYLLKWKAKEKASRCISIGERAGLYLIFQPFPYRGMKKRGSERIYIFIFSRHPKGFNRFPRGEGGAPSWKDPPSTLFSDSDASGRSGFETSAQEPTSKDEEELSWQYGVQQLSQPSSETMQVKAKSRSQEAGFRAWFNRADDLNESREQGEVSRPYG